MKCHEKKFQSLLKTYFCILFCSSCSSALSGSGNSSSVDVNQSAGGLRDRISQPPPKDALNWRHISPLMDKMAALHSMQIAFSTYCWKSDCCRKNESQENSCCEISKRKRDLKEFFVLVHKSIFDMKKKRLSRNDNMHSRLCRLAARLSVAWRYRPRKLAKKRKLLFCHRNPLFRHFFGGPKTMPMPRFLPTPCAILSVKTRH